MSLMTAIPACAGLFIFTQASWAVPPVDVRDGHLASSWGATLYVFDGDGDNLSRCDRGCVMVWPPLAASADERAQGDFSLLERADGTRQWAHRGRPLYRFAGDRKAGDRAGENAAGTWHTVRP